ncbi:MAG: hypothetical protein NTU76_03615 [Candidatus Taylorbacteria bacterium]|nr:hypothetical protein [Candidatus Taylorbacteria bacterium]
MANINSNYIKGDQSGLAETTIKVQIPCTGHSFLIIQEINKVEGVSGVKFVSPDVFVVRYDTKNTSPEKIVSQDIFKEYEAIIE